MSNRSSALASHFNYIPKDWNLEKLNGLVKKDKKITYGIVQPGEFDDHGILLIRGQDYMNGWKNRSSFFKVSPALHAKFKRSTTSAGDVLLSIAGYTGQPAIVPDWIEEANLTQTTARISCNPDAIFNRYLYYFLLSDEGRMQSRRNAKGSAQEGLNLEDVEKYYVAFPPLPEQQKIAAILTSVDDVIESTQAQINKLKDLKTGMMQELLTKGIGHSEFKDSPVGRIPKAWSSVTVIDSGIKVLDGDRGAEYPKDADFFAYEYCLFLSAKNVTKAGFKFEQLAFITKEKDEKLRKGKLTLGDIVITTRGTVGNIAYFDNSVPFQNIRINSGMAIIRNEKTNFHSEFLNAVLHSRLVGEQIELMAFGSAQPQLTIGVIQNINLPLPPKDEQVKIFNVISSLQKKLDLAESKLSLFSNTKKALMQDLLTGKVRVKVN
jgi:type I restriction enzyme S subunit